MQCGQIVNENICVAATNNASRCTFKSVSIIEVKVATSCGANDIALISYEEQSAPFPALNPSDVAQVFSVGFASVLLCFLTARSVGVVLNLIRKG